MHQIEVILLINVSNITCPIESMVAECDGACDRQLKESTDVSGGYPLSK